MTRFEQATMLLEKRKFFKLVCGAGNEDPEQVEKYVLLYALSGAKCFDVSASASVVKAAVKGIDKAYETASLFNRKMVIKPFINVSIGMKGDPHIRKARINENCVKCGACVRECLSEAIDKDIKVIQARCIGCGNCASVCSYSAIEFYHEEKDIWAILDRCKKAGCEMMELHAAIAEEEAIWDDWIKLNDIVKDNYVSMCLDRRHLSDTELKRRIFKAKEISGNRLMIQADGIPMSGGEDDYNSTLQAVAIADIIVKSGIDSALLLSGGTNSLTAELADKCGVRFDGVSIGSFARKIVKDFIKDPGFLGNTSLIEKTLSVTDNLVRTNIGEPLW